MQTVTIGDETVKQETLVPLDGQDNPVTLYGGTVTIYDDGSADVVSRRGSAVASSFSTISRWSGTPYVEFSLPGASSTSGNVRSDFQCSMFKPGGRAAGNTFRISTKCYLFISSETTLEDMNAVASQIQAVYPLATPVTYHFTNLEELKVWLGENNFWCDISDDISVKYWNRGFGN